MKAIYSRTIIAGLAGLLCACSATQNAGKSAKSNYIDKKSSLYVNGVTIPSTNNACVDQFTFLKGTSVNEYNDYSRSYTTIGDGYRFLNVNQKIMNTDAKDVYTMKLDMKLDTLCSKLQYSGYQVVKEKMKVLTNI